ncbi:reverse transcriptase domain-containing protein [Nocardiopsis nanhaiensis]
MLDLDIRAYFDTVPWDLVLKAVAHHIAPDQKWILLYVERWLQAPLRQEDGMLVERDRGTAQGPGISPLLANLFMHYAFDGWLVREFPSVTFERYCDDAVVHCRSQKQAIFVRDAIARRLRGSLELHPDKTRIVYCKDADRQGLYEHTKFTFLGYEFRPRLARNKHGKHFVSFLPAVSTDAMKAMGREIRSWHLARRSDKSLDDLARMFNSIVQGWVNYYGRFYSPSCSTSSAGSTGSWSGGPVGNTDNGCATGNAVRWAGLPRSLVGLRACSRTGVLVHVLTVGRWESNAWKSGLSGSGRGLRKGTSAGGASSAAHFTRRAGRGNLP